MADTVINTRVVIPAPFAVTYLPNAPVSVQVKPSAPISVTVSTGSGSGSAGPTGATGATGAQGATGPAGPQNLYVQDAAPTLTAGQVWIQTFANHDLSIWVEDGH